MEALLKELNPVLRGWHNYFRWGNSTRKFTQVDSYVHERLALYDSKKQGRSELDSTSGATGPKP